MVFSIITSISRIKNFMTPSRKDIKMTQSVGAQVKPVLDKEGIIKYGPAAGGVIAIIGLLLAALGFVLPWLKFKILGETVTLSGLEFLTKSGGEGVSANKEYLAMIARGSSYNALMCNLPFFLCGAFVIAVLIIVAVFARRFPSQLKLFGSIALGLFGAFSCCPTVLFFIDLQKDMWNEVDIQFGFYLAVLGIGIILLGGIVGIAIVLLGGGFPKRNRQ
jgi:hypothetical protein